METRKDGQFIPLHVDVDLTYLNPGRMSRLYCEKLKNKSRDNLNKILADLDERVHELTDIVLTHFDVKSLPYHNHDIAFDTMACRLSHDNIETPDGFKHDHLKELGKHMTNIHCGMMSLDRESLKLFWGNVIHKMLNLMKSEDKQMIISSCHDNSLLCVLCSIYGEDITKIGLEWPNYGSFVIFEVWKKENEEKYVKVIYNGETLNVFDGNDYIDLNGLEEKWRDITIDEETYFKNACLC